MFTSRPNGRKDFIWSRSECPARTQARPSWCAFEIARLCWTCLGRRMGAFRAKAIFCVAGLASLIACAWSLTAGPLDKWEWLYPRPTGAHLNGVAYGAGQFVAVGANESIVRSSDGTNWTLVRGLANGTNLNAVCWGNGAFVAVGAQGLVLISSDGSNWVRRVAFRGDLNSVTFGDGLFIAVGGGPVTGSGVQTNWILGSPNGFSWGLMLNIPAAPTYAGVLTDVTWGPDGFVAVGVPPLSPIFFSPDGFSWQQATNTPQSYELAGVTYGDGRYVATGPYTTISSTNGLRWSARDFIGHYNSDVAYGNGVYVIVGNLGVVGYSANATRWTSFPWGTFSSELKDIAFGGGQFVAVGPNGVLANSVNGADWVWHPAMRMQYLARIACGPQGCVVTDSMGVTRISSDFASWTIVRSNSAWYNLFYADGWYIAPHDSGTIYVSSNLTNWTSHSAGTTNAFHSYATGNGLHVVSGNRGTIGISSNALNWSAVYLGVPNNLGEIAFGNGRFLTVNSDGDVGISSNAFEWTYHSRLMPPNGVSQLAFGNGVFLGLASTGLVVRSADGLLWQSNKITTNMYSAILSFNHGLFLVSAPVSSQGSSVFVSRFGTNWTRYPMPYLGDVTVAAMNGRRMIAGDRGGRFVQSDLFPALGIQRGAELQLSLGGAPGFYRIEAAITLRGRGSS
jgi:hypothetical protein